MSVDVVTEDLEVSVSDEVPLSVELGSSSASLLTDIEDALVALDPGAEGPASRAADAVRFFDFSMERSIFTSQAIPRLLQLEPIVAATVLISAENDELIVEGYRGGSEASDRVFSVGHREMDFPNTLVVRNHRLRRDQVLEMQPGFGRGVGRLARDSLESGERRDHEHPAPGFHPEGQTMPVAGLQPVREHRHPRGSGEEEGPPGRVRGEPPLYPAARAAYAKRETHSA